MKLSRQARCLGTVVTTGIVALSAALVTASPASADSHGCTIYGLQHYFCIKVVGAGLNVKTITAYGKGAYWNGYVIATVASQGKTAYKKKSHYKKDDSKDVFQVGKNFRNHSQACVTGYSIQNGKYHQFAKACKEIHG